MPRSEYVLFTALGSAVWNALLIGAALLLRHGLQTRRASREQG